LYLFSSVHQDNSNDFNDIEISYFKASGFPNHFGLISDKVGIITRTRWIKTYGSLAQIISIIERVTLQRCF